MTLNRAKNIRRFFIILAALALALMFFSKNFVLVASCPSPTSGQYALRITDNFITFYRVPDVIDWGSVMNGGRLNAGQLPKAGRVPLTRFEVQRRRVYFDPDNSGKRYTLESYPHLNLPIWLPLALTVVPLAFFIWRIQIKNKQKYRCPQCNYNLKKNTSGTCPECGTKIINQQNKEPNSTAPEPPNT